MIQIRMQQGLSQDAWIIRQAFFSCVHKEGGLHQPPAADFDFSSNCKLSFPGRRPFLIVAPVMNGV